MHTDAKIERIEYLYDAGASLDSILASVGVDDDTLRLIHKRLGVSMKTLRAHAEDIQRGIIDRSSPRD